MRWLLLAGVVTAIGCSSTDAAPVFMEVDYQLRCLSCEPRSPDNAKRQFALLDGDPGEEPGSRYRIECHASTVSNDRVLSFSARYESPSDSKFDHSLEVLQVEYGKDAPGSKCEVRVREGNNRYIGKCSDGEPEAEAPCQVELSVDDGIVSGTLFCVGIANEAAESSTRHLVLSDPANASEPDDMPARFEVHGCIGL